MPLLSTLANASARGYGTFGGVAASTNSYESIATVTVGAGGSSSISFSSIPSTYKHLQIRLIARTNWTGGTFDGLKINFNSDTASNYSWHQVGGQGSVALAQAGSTTGTIYAPYVASNNAGSNVFGAGIVDVLDYQNTNKYKTLRNLMGTDNNGGGYVMLGSGLWQSASAVSSIQITQWDGSSFNQYSSLALYGIKG